MKRALKITKILFLAMVIVFLAGCGEKLDFAVVPTKATINNTSALHDDLISIPPPQEKISNGQSFTKKRKKRQGRKGLRK